MSAEMCGNCFCDLLIIGCIFLTLSSPPLFVLDKLL